MPRSGLLQTNQRYVVTAATATTGGDVTLNYGNNTSTAPTTSFWQFSVTGTSTFNLNRVNSSGVSLNVLNCLENGTTRFTGANGFVEILHGVGGGVGIDIVNSGSVASYLDFRMAGGNSDFDFRVIEQSPTILSFLGQSGSLVNFGLATQFSSGITSLTPVALTSDTIGSGIFRFMFGSSPRWDIGRNNATETGGATGRGGSDFFLAAYNNSGASALVPLYIARADSRTTFLASGYRSGAFQSNHDQTALTANRTVTWPDLDGRVVLQPTGSVTDGQLLIGNSATGAFSRASLTAGSGITLTPGNGTLTIAASGGGGGSSIGDLTQETVVNPFDDFFGFRDTSAGADRRFAFLNHPLMRPDRYFIAAIGWFAGTNTANIGATLVFNGAGGASANTNTFGVPFGFVRFGTSNAATGRAAYTTATNNNRLRFDSGKRWYWSGRFYVPTVSDATETFIIKFGFDNNPNNGANGTNGVYFRYTHSEANGNWQVVAVSNNLASASDTGIAPASTEGTQQFLELLYTPGTGIQAWIDGTPVSVPTSNLPLGAGRESFWQIGIYKSTGTTERTFLTRATVIVGEL